MEQVKEPVNYLRSQVVPLALEYTVRLDREMTQPSDFHEELATIRACTENDVLKILINSGGGSIAVAKAFLSAMAQCPAQIICEIVGECCSAATFVFLAGDELRISDDAEFMIHTASYGYGGKENNVRQYVQFQEKATSRLLRKYYKHYLTEEEIDSVIEGKDLWHDAEELSKRLEHRSEMFQREYEEAQQQALEEQTAMLMEDFPTKEELEAMDKEELIAFILDDGVEKEELVLEDSIPEECFTEEVEDKTFNEVLEMAFNAVDKHSEGKHFYRIELEDCEGITFMDIYKDGTIIDDSGLEEFTSFMEEIENSDLGLFYLKSVADALGITYAHNIGKKKLARRIDVAVAEIVDDLNQ